MDQFTNIQTERTLGLPDNQLVLKDIKTLQSDVSSTQNTLRGGNVDNQSIQTLYNMQNELR